jgi:hypothetical protein
LQPSKKVNEGWFKSKTKLNPHCPAAEYLFVFDSQLIREQMAPQCSPVDAEAGRIAQSSS